VCGNVFVLMRQVGAAVEFQYISNIYEPQLTKMKSPEIAAPPEHWVIIPPLYS
jgi:hypothetical protein